MVTGSIRKFRPNSRAYARIPLHARLRLATIEGKPVAPLSRCIEIGIGGLRGSAALGLVPGTRLRVAVELPSGRVFETRGHVAWSKTTLHLALFGTPLGMDDDADFGIAFDDVSPVELRPVARLLVARQHQRRRARRIRRLHGLPSHA